MNRFVWRYVSSYFEWTGDGEISFTNKDLMDKVNTFYDEGGVTKLDRRDKSLLWNMTFGYKTPEEFAALLARYFGPNVRLVGAPDAFKEWHYEKSTPLNYEGCATNDL